MNRPHSVRCVRRLPLSFWKARAFGLPAGWLLLAAIFSSAAAAADTSRPREDIALEIGEPLALRDFGGPEAEITIHAASAHAVTYSVSDFTRLERVIDRDRFGHAIGSRLVPRSFRRSLRLKLGAARQLPGDFSKGYLLYKQDGIYVYYDTKLPPLNTVYLAITRSPLPPDD